MTLPGWPRGMPAELAAAYIGLSASGLRVEVRAGRISATVLTPGRVVYLREDLDSYLDARAGRTPAPVEAENPWLTAL